MQPGAGMVGAQAQHLAERLRGFTIPSELEEHAAEGFVGGHGRGREGERGARLGLRVGNLAQTSKHDHEIEAGAEVVGAYGDRLAKRLGRFCEASLPRLRACAVATGLERVHQRPGRGRSKMVAIMWSRYRKSNGFGT